MNEDEIEDYILTLEYWLENIKDCVCNCLGNDLDPSLHFNDCPYRELGVKYWTKL